MIYSSYETPLSIPSIVSQGGKLFNYNCSQDFPGGPVDRNPPANAGDRDSIPGPERFHVLWSN